MYKFKAFALFFFLTLPCVSLLNGCASTEKKPELPADKLYTLASDYMQRGMFEQAIKHLETIESHYPFSPLATQAQFDLIYAYYKSSKYPQGAAQTQKFVRLNPTHADLDYVYYMQGLLYQAQYGNPIFDLIRSSKFQRDPTPIKHAFESYQTLLQSYPKSIYARDARARMLDIRHNLAAHTLAIAQYYSDRSAWLAVIQRTTEVLTNYPQERSVVMPALHLMKNAYVQLGLTQQAENTQRVIDKNKNKTPS